MEPYKREFRYANFGIRWGALLIDINIVVLLILLFTKQFFSLLSELNLRESGPETFAIFIVGILFGPFVFGILVRAFFESSKYGGTPGKIAVGIKVVDYEGNQITFSRALKRNLAKILSGLIFYAGYLRVLLSDKRQGLHDAIANTYVIRRD